MNSVLAHYIVFMSWISEEVGECTCIDTSFQEGDRMLRNASIVVVVVNNEQMTFQVACIVLQVAFFISFRIGLWSIHIAFAIHHFVVLPIDNGTTGNAYFEYLGIAKHQACCHVSAKAPTMNSDRSE